MLTFKTTNPELLLATYKKAIADGHVETWEMSGEDFAHTPAQFRFQAWMRPIVLPGQLVVGIIGRNDEPLKRGIYAVFHGRFQESMLAHCDELFADIECSALLVPGVDLYLLAASSAAA